jgi:hypothetical protein
VTPDAGVTVAQTDAVSASARVCLDETATPNAVFGDLVDHERLQEAIVDAIRDLLAGEPADDAVATLEDAGLVATDGADGFEEARFGIYRALCTRIATGDRRAVFDFLCKLRQIGSGRTSTADREQVVPPLFANSTITPTIVVRIEDSFLQERRADQRRSVCRFLSALARGCDLRLVGSRIAQRRLVERHAGDLPPGVSEQCSTALAHPVLSPRRQPRRSITRVGR